MIVLDDVSVKLQGKLIVTSATATFPSRSIAYISGVNGVGKSSLLRGVVGLQRIRGSVHFDGRPLRSTRPALVMLFDRPAFYPRATGRTNLALLLGKDRMRSEKLNALGALVDDEILDTRAASLSTGQAKRLQLAMTLLVEPRFAILDEPFDGLDEASLEVAKTCVRELANSATIVLTGQNREFCEALADCRFALEAGVLTATSPKGEARSM